VLQHRADVLRTSHGPPEAGECNPMELRSAEELLVIVVMRIALVSCVLVGCAYQPGSFVHPQRDFRGQRTTVGCLDLAVERRTDLALGPVLAYQFANRCDHLTTVDLGGVSVVGRNAEGTDIVLRPYDPRAELHPVALDGRKAGGEWLAYPADRAIPQVCIDAATLAHQGPPHWLCFGSAAGTVVGSVP
jgi:hypothetical protein